jgi:hypothetical protein
MRLERRIIAQVSRKAGRGGKKRRARPVLPDV